MYLNFPPSNAREEKIAAAVLAVRASTDDSDYCYGLSCGNEWVWARWVLLVFFLVAIASLALTAIKINGRRVRLGQRPIIGTAWFTPPSYRQSERQYRSGTQDYVPPYTETANENDLGYYDNQGAFHLSSKAENTSPPPPLDTDEVFEYPQEPPSAVTRDDVSADRFSVDFTRDFHHYYRGTAAEQSTSGIGPENNNDQAPRPSVNPSADVASSPIEMQQIPKKPEEVRVHRV
ncbi:LAME_0B03378g1_1 [Lachancea meyersii CBS 8951]|uniref:LAME_0B03378g1_1 n=1 Tax=Lachancea meyersii CBS 8951 TaxID=1266667 RepID=A0A1G4IU11_9SACH|nr:LAME_0B03378g1_1 [Lachancea meyersii CBS 8951]